MASHQVDVLMTVYNGAEHVRIAIDSLRQQTLKNFQLHVVDDGSTDATPKILAELAAAEPRMQIYIKPNTGVVDSSNFGLRYCTSKYVARLDADDRAYPERLAQQVAFLDAHPDVLAESGTADKIDTAGRRIGLRAFSSSPDKADPLAIPAKEPYLLHPFVIFRKEGLERIGGYRHLIVSEDSDVFWRLQELGPLHATTTVYGEYRMNPESLSSKSVSYGRIMATCSQLAAFSALRRRAGKPDLEFSPEFSSELRAASHSLERICQVASRGMDTTERDRLLIRVGFKLIEMADYRPYEVELDDCKLIGEVVRGVLPTAAPTSAAFIRRSCSGTAARLAAKGKRAEAEALLSPDMKMQYWARYAMRKLVPTDSHQQVRAFASPVIGLFRRS